MNRALLVISLILVGLTFYLSISLFQQRAQYDQLLDEWVDQEKKVQKLEWENRRMKIYLNDGALPIPEVNEDPFAEAEEIPL